MPVGLSAAAQVSLNSLASPNSRRQGHAAQSPPTVGLYVVPRIWRQQPEHEPARQPIPTAAMAIDLNLCLFRLTMLRGWFPTLSRYLCPLRESLTHEVAMSINGPSVVATFALENSADCPTADRSRIAESIECEKARLEALERYDIIDTAREEAFDRITRVARKALRVPVCTISLIDGHRAWVKSGEGVPDNTEVPRDHAFCYHTIQQNEPLVVCDATQDARFASNPFVIGEPRVRFYAGVPLHTLGGVNVGTLCTVDMVPRDFGPEELAMLTDFARMVMDQLELRLLVATDSLTGTFSRRAFK
jgi:hypothetical protein